MSANDYLLDLADSLGPAGTIFREAAESVAALQAGGKPSTWTPPSDTPRPRPEIPACWSWPRPYPGDLEEHSALEVWQDGRCAVCSWRPPAGGLVDDHDHDSGLRRGWLCRGCNTGEGVSRERVFALYRWRNPATIIGLELLYSGWGWERGRVVLRAWA